MKLFNWIETFINIYLGKYFFPDGRRYEGAWRDDNQNGRGIEII